MPSSVKVWQLEREGTDKWVAIILLGLHHQELVFWVFLWRGVGVAGTAGRGEGGRERENEAEDENRFSL